MSSLVPLETLEQPSIRIQTHVRQVFPTVSFIPVRVNSSPSGPLKLERALGNRELFFLWNADCGGAAVAKESDA